MQHRTLAAAAAAHLLCLLPACGDSGDDPTAGSSETTDPTAPPTTGASTTDAPPADTGETTDADTTGGTSETLCARLGGPPGIGQLVDGFLAVVIHDARINGYFLTNTLDLPRLGKCVTDQLGAAVACEGVTYACQSMLESHADLGISTQDFMDFAEDFHAAWAAHKQKHPDLTADDLTTVDEVLASLAPQIVEDLDSTATVYQRVGRKPAISDLVGKPGEAGSFVDTVANDVAINGFFGNADFTRLHTCLTRQLLGAAGGPDTYGRERSDLPPDVDPGASQATPCADMLAAHADLVDINDNLGISHADFTALVMDLSTAMIAADIAMDDQTALLAALAPLCDQIVTVDPAMCAMP